jgi:DNA-binding PadR family transcriptional regulator
MVTNRKFRFNELHKTLLAFGARMSKPTLIQHLAHLRKKGFMIRKKEDRQNVSYRVNWKKFEHLKEALDYKQRIDQNLKNERTFKLLPLDEQVITISSILALGELLRLKFDVLDVLEPNGKPEHSFAYIFAHKLLDCYRLWFIDTCKESKENGQKALELIQRAIDGFECDVFEKKPISMS